MASSETGRGEDFVANTDCRVYVRTSSPRYSSRRGRGILTILMDYGEYLTSNSRVGIDIDGLSEGSRTREFER